MKFQFTTWGNLQVPIPSRGQGQSRLSFHNPARNRVYVANYYGSSVSVLKDSGGGVEERQTPDARRTTPIPAIVRGVLELAVGSRQHIACRTELLDICGRKTLDLRPGPNDVSRLAPGVYFVRSAGSGERLAVQKVVVTR